MSAQPFPTRAELMRQYEISVDLYKHHLKLAIELNIFYYAITGAIVSYYLAHQSEPLMRWALALPLLMSLLFVGLFIYGGVQQNAFRYEVFRIRDALGLRVAPELLVLSIFLYIYSALMFGVAVGLGALMLCGGHAT